MPTDTLPVLLTDDERKARLNEIIRKLRRLYDPGRWSTPEAFEQSFVMDNFAISGDMHKLREAFTFMLKVGWMKNQERARSQAKRA